MPMCRSKQQKFERWELVANAAYDQDQAADWLVEAGYTHAAGKPKKGQALHSTEFETMITIKSHIT